MMKRLILVLIAFLALGGLAQSQESGIAGELNQGIELYQQGSYEKALGKFRNITLNPGLDASLGDAYFWLAKSYLILGQYDDAEKNLDFFLMNYPSHAHTAEASYLNGRLLYLLEDFEGSIQALQVFVDAYADSPFIPNAYFWVGEALFQLGRFDQSQQILEFLLREFPRSVKVEAARYRISLIQFKKREDELLKLLKLSHEEALKSMEEFQRKERTYEQAISAYQRKLSAYESGTAPTAVEIAGDSSGIEDQLRQKDAEIAALKSELQSLKKQLSDYAASSASSQTDTQAAVIETADKTRDASDIEQLQKLLEAKAAALELKAYLLELSRLGGQ
jgi:TolA-binding protein